AADGPEKGERDCYDTDCMQPAERAPIRIRDLKKPSRKEQNQRNCNNSELEGRALSRRGWWTGRRPSLQAEPKQNDREKRNEPAVAVLIVDRPFAAQLPPKPEPKEGKKNDDCDSAERKSPNDGRRCFRHIFCGNKVLHKIDILHFLPSHFCCIIWDHGHHPRRALFPRLR